MFLAAGCAVTAGCSRQRADYAAPVAPVDTLANGLMRSMVPELSPWLAMWRAAIPGITAASLRSQGRVAALRGGTFTTSAQFDSFTADEPATFAVLIAQSPGGRYKLIFDRYQSIREEDGEIEIGGEPDSAPVLIDEQLERAHTFEFCGTPCGYDWGCWLDSTRFALGGWAQVGDRSDSLTGVLGIYSLADSTETRHVTLAVSSDQYANYMEAWRGWVRARYVERQSARAASSRGE